MRARFIRLRVGRAQAAHLREELERQGVRAFRDQDVVEALWPESDDQQMAAWLEAWLEKSRQGTVGVLDDRTLEVGEELFRAASPDPAPPTMTS